MIRLFAGAALKLDDIMFGMVVKGMPDAAQTEASPLRSRNRDAMSDRRRLSARRLCGPSLAGSNQHRPTR